MVVDSEEEFHSSEILKLQTDITKKGLSLIIFADWYNTTVIKAAKFFDENSRQLWTPVTGGSNIPAINDLLKPFGIGLGDRVYEGGFQIGVILI
jgi:membrane-bound transcription factor site-1 protease